MSGFTSQQLEKRLGDLNSSAQTIQTFSLWLIHHRKHHKLIVQTWFKELKKATISRKLTFMYLANDVIQNSRKKGPEFTKEFAGALKAAFAAVAKEADEKTWKGLERILAVWGERNIYDSNQISEWRKAIDDFKPSKNGSTDENNGPTKKERTSTPVANDAKRFKASHKSNISKTTANTNSSSIKNTSSYSTTGAKNSMKKAISKQSDNNGTKIERSVKFDDSKLTVNETSIAKVIDPEELISALHELEHSASSDANVREKIASLPPEVSDASLLKKIRDKDAAERLQRQVNEACIILADYNNRLALELEERKKISNMLYAFVKNQKDSLTLAEQRLAEFKEKLQSVSQVRDELKSHLQNLPDLSLLPSISGGLAPLPSAGDLFSIAAAKAAMSMSMSANSSMGSTSSASPNTASPADYGTPTSTGTPNSGTEEGYSTRS
ncbi:regulation of nuclear pre-mRNA domain-containing protein 1B [Tetranychus urticae]|uniref:CID domain-containing protein n=1 Tax=Tetranychus urticae TaxID=32264 RepID=T1KTW4_TETUR|nr:regulation of nuclear pre-mRNA domain-containing protein 1B [Tetranychus urticae]